MMTRIPTLTHSYSREKSTSMLDKAYLFRAASAFGSALTSSHRVLNCPQLFGHNEMKWLHGVFGARHRYCPLTGSDKTGGKPIRPSTRYTSFGQNPAQQITPGFEDLACALAQRMGVRRQRDRHNGATGF